MNLNYGADCESGGTWLKKKTNKQAISALLMKTNHSCVLCSDTIFDEAFENVKTKRSI